MDLLICGASVRAAAGSAVRAGLRPQAIDRFADRDLSAMCPTHCVAAERWPAGVTDLALRLPSSPWIYTGGLENHPKIVDQIAATRPLCGNAGDVLRAVRDPFRLAQVLHAAGMACPALMVRPDAIAHGDGGRWLVKPLASAGGVGIEFYNSAPERETVYYQQWIDGPSFSAVFIARRDGCECAGVTRQLTGRPYAEFGYYGSIGPFALAPPVQKAVERLGVVIALAFGLVGLFGIDFIVNDGLPWPVEVNPRYTASVEVLELATGRPLLADHVRACAGSADDAAHSHPRPPCGGGSARGMASSTAVASARLPRPHEAGRLVGKRILFANRRSLFPALGPNARFRTIADVPQDGTPFEPGDPVLTVFATGRTIEQCAARLERRSTAWLARLRAI